MENLFIQRVFKNNIGLDFLMVVIFLYNLNLQNPEVENNDCVKASRHVGILSSDTKKLKGLRSFTINLYKMADSATIPYYYKGGEQEILLIVDATYPTFQVKFSLKL